MAEGTEVGTAYVSIVPSAAGFGAKLQAQIAGEAEAAGVGAGKALGAGITTSASGIAKGVAGIFAVVGATKFLKGSIAEAEEAERVGRLTEAVIKSTGGAAGVTAVQVDALANKLSKVAGIDDEVIQAGENVLLTFTKIRNQVGAGNDIFNQTTQAALDMSAALGGDLQGSVVQLGKALQDPTQGLLALRRSGVSFTAEMQDQIKALQASGDLLGAQKLILGEVNREFGGAAAASATGLDKLHVSVKNLEESLGTALLPSVNAAAGGLTGMLGVFTDLPGPVQAVAGGFLALGAAATVVGLLAPKLRTVRTELEGMGAAGRGASGALGALGKIGGAIAIAGAVIEGSNALGNAITNIAAGKAAPVNALTSALVDLGTSGQVTGELANQLGDDLGQLNKKAFEAGSKSGIARLGADVAGVLNPSLQDSKRDVDGIDKALAGLVSSGHADVAKAALDRLTTALLAGPDGAEAAAKFIGALNDYKEALSGVDVQGKLTTGTLGPLGDAAGTAGDQAGTAADSWKALGDRIKEFAATQISDWSTKIAGDLQSALNPMERFGADTAKNVASLKEAVSGAATDLTKAKADLAKLDAPTGTAGDIARLRGTGATADQLDAARAKVTAAAAKLAASQSELAGAQESPFRKLKDNLTANLKTVTDWKANLDKLAGRGKVGEALAKDLGALGPAAAGAVAEATRKTGPELDQMEKLFTDSGKIVADAASGALEQHLDQLASNGELIATITSKAYQDALPPKMMAATLLAMDDVHRQLLGLGPKVAGVTPGISGPAAPSPVLAAPTAPPLINVPGFTMPGGGGQAPQITIPFQVTSNADPRQIAGEVGDAVAWRLAPRATLPG